MAAAYPDVEDRFSLGTRDHGTTGIDHIANVTQSAVSDPFSGAQSADVATGSELPYQSIFSGLQPAQSTVEDPFSLHTPGFATEVTDTNALTLLHDISDPFTGLPTTDNHEDSGTCIDAEQSLESLLADLGADQEPGVIDRPSAISKAQHDEATEWRNEVTGDFGNDIFSEHFLADSLPFHQLDRLDKPGFEKYELRLGPRLGEPVPSCFQDEDQTDDFDPKKPGAIAYVPLKRKRESIYEEGYGPPSRSAPRGPSRITYRHGRNVGKSFIVKLKFETAAGKAFFPLFDKSSVSQPENTSNGESSDPDSGFYSASHKSSEISPSTHEQCMQRRSKRAAMPQSTDDDDEDDEEGTLKLEDLTLGHPAARGCKPCFELGLECDLLFEGTSYPCTSCLDDKVDCELILQPEKKRGCEGCKKRRIQCSYRHEGSDHSKSCDQCFNLGHDCIAGPFTGRTRTGPALDQTFSIVDQSVKPKPAPGLLSESSTDVSVVGNRRSRAQQLHETPNSISSKDITVPDKPFNDESFRKIKRQRIINAIRHPVPQPKPPQSKTTSSTSFRQQKINELLKPVPRQEHNAPIKLFSRKVDASAKKRKKEQQTIKTVGGIMAPVPKISRYSGYTVTNPYSLPTPPSTPGRSAPRPITEEVAPAPSAPLVAETFTITTRLAHPIQLNFLPSAVPSTSSTSQSQPAIPPCHFHPLTIYPLLGLPVATPLVAIDSSSPSSSAGGGYIELLNGHTQQGFPATRICPSCTTERLRIMQCSGHEMRALGAGERYAGPVGGYMESSMAESMGGEGAEGEGKDEGKGNAKAKPWKWCHICPTPAVYTCRKAQDHGCPLTLCGPCALRLNVEFHGKLEALVETMLVENDAGRGFGVRADVELLLRRGRLGDGCLGNEGGWGGMKGEGE